MNQMPDVINKPSTGKPVIGDKEKASELLSEKYADHPTVSGDGRCTSAGQSIVNSVGYTL